MTPMTACPTSAPATTAPATTVTRLPARAAGPRRAATILVLIGLVLAVVTSCTPPTSTALSFEDPAFDLVNEFRASEGRSALTRVAELEDKAQAHAETMAAAGHIFHSSNLSAGVSPGWQMIGENVASAGTIEQAQHALELSPPHRKNLLEPGYTEAGVGVVERDSMVFVVQVFVKR